MDRYKYIINVFDRTNEAILKRGAIKRRIFIGARIRQRELSMSTSHCHLPIGIKKSIAPIDAIRRYQFRERNFETQN